MAYSACFLKKNVYCTQNYIPKCDKAHTEQPPSNSIIIQGNAPQICTQANLVTGFSQFKFRLSKWLLLVSNWHTSSHCTISPALRAFLRSVWCQNCSHKIFMSKTVHLLSFFVIILTIRVWVVKHMLRCNFPVNVFLLFVFSSYKCILFCMTDNTNFPSEFCWLYLPWIQNEYQGLYSVIFSPSFVQLLENEFHVLTCNLWKWSLSINHSLAFARMNRAEMFWSSYLTECLNTVWATQ